MKHSLTKQKLWLLALVVASTMTGAAAARHGTKLPAVEKVTDYFQRFGFEQKFMDFYGAKNVLRAGNGSAVNLVLDKSSGCGFKSKEVFNHGFFSAAIKLPSGFSAGVVVAFYMSNNEVYAKNHDEIDFELLGHEKQKDWVLQTNIYVNGSMSIGREEKFKLWFDPTLEFHEYSILWNDHHIVFFVDSIPIREVIHTEAVPTYPFKPMSLFSTIWDGSDWATHGGKKPINYNYSPFVASFKDFELQGCVLNLTQSTTIPCHVPREGNGATLDPIDGLQFVKLSQDQQLGMDWVRNEFMFYSYCNDPNRFHVLPPECNEGR